MQIGYVRVSTTGQDHALQIDALEKLGCDRIFVEVASGTRSDRPELRAALDFARENDTLVVYSLSRLARSIRNLLDISAELDQRRIALKSVSEQIDTTSPAGRFMFTILGALSEMEVSLLRERTRAGLLAARARGRVGGRPRSLDPLKLNVARSLLAEGRMTVREVAQHLGIATSSLYRSLPGGRSAISS